MRKTILLFYILIFNLSDNFLMCQVQLELDSNLVVNNLDTVSVLSPLYELARNNTKQLQVKPSNSIDTIEGLQDILYYSNFTDYGANYEKGHFYRHENTVYLGGLIRRISGGPYISGDILFVLPITHRPKFRILASAGQNGTMLRVDIQTNGIVSVISSASNTLDFLSLDGISFKTSSLFLGQEVAGGYLFYVADPPSDLDGDGIDDLGLVAAYNNVNSSDWGCIDTFFGITNEFPGAGFNNTIDIINACSEANISAKVVDNLVTNGYDDWYLPSYSELQMMWSALADSDSDGTNGGLSDPGNIGGFGPFSYQSSTERTTRFIKGVSFSNGAYLSGLFKNLSYSIRPVRVFKLSDL